VSDASRLSRLSQRSTRGLSTEELECAEVDAKRQRLRRLMRRNQKTCHGAIHNPDLKSKQHSAIITMPKEFHLSASSAKARTRPGVSFSEGQRNWHHSLRQPLASKDSTTERGLTVPEAPHFLTSQRARGVSVEPSDRRAMSLHQLPPREQVAIEHHLDCVASARGVPPSQHQMSRPRAPCPGPKAEERAQRARVAAQARHEQTVAVEKERLCVFQANVGRRGG